MIISKPCMHIQQLLIFLDGESELEIEAGEYAEVLIWVDSDVEISSNQSIGTWSSLPVFHTGPAPQDWTPAGTR